MNVENQEKLIALQKIARSIRINAVKMTQSGNSSHVGSALSIADILAAVYGSFMKFDPKAPDLEERDRFILSKGHAGAAVYAALAEVGYFSAEVLNSHYKNGSILSGHVSHKGVPGVEFSTGSLGHGLGVGAGVAYAAKLDGDEFRTLVLMSDGECDEGSNWEAVLFAAHHKLSNLIAIVDYNKLQSLESTSATLELEPFTDKWEAFGWSVVEVDGHNIPDLLKALNSYNLTSSPTCIIANTIKGKGVSFMENEVLWHYRSPQGDEYKLAIKELTDA